MIQDFSNTFLLNKNSGKTQSSDK